MITEEQIQSAIAAGILDETTANALKAHATNRHMVSSNVADEEHFQLVTGFNDIFVVIACLLLLISMGWIGGEIIGSILAATTAWILAEFFVIKRRMALPAIVLLLTFVGYVFYATVEISKTLEGTTSAGIIAAAMLTTLAAWLHWLRFKVPITVAAGTAALISSIFGIIKGKEFLVPIMIGLGIVVFLFAMRWDAQDISRKTRKSDVGFWLHLLAAPLIIHPVFDLIGVLQGNIQPAQALVVFMLYVAIAVTSLLIDRRALMVSALGYVIYVFSSVLDNAGRSTGLAITALVIGSALLILSAYWHKCRAFVLRYSPKRLLQYLPK